MGESAALPNRAVSSRRTRALLRARGSDERLARLVSRGDEDAFAELYARHHQALYRYCRSILRDGNEAQDALQSAMTRAFAALRAGERDLAVRPWLFRIAHNEAISLLRKRRPQDVEVGEAALAAPQASMPEQALQQRERIAALLQDLGTLAERQRAALLMRELSGLSIEEIGAALSISAGAAKQTLFEARSALRELAEGRAVDCESIRAIIDERDGRILRRRLVRSHLRSCASCREFEQAIAARSTDLHALAPPLPAAAASVLLARLLSGSATPHASAAALGGAGTTAAGGGVGASSGAGAGIGVATSMKSIAAVVLVASAAAGATHVALSKSSSHGGPSITRRAPGNHGAGGAGGTGKPGGADGTNGTGHHASNARAREGGALRGGAANAAASGGRGTAAGAIGERLRGRAETGAAHEGTRARGSAGQRASAEGRSRREGALRGRRGEGSRRRDGEAQRRPHVRVRPSRPRGGGTVGASRPARSQGSQGAGTESAADGGSAPKSKTTTTTTTTTSTASGAAIAP